MYSAAVWVGILTMRARLSASWSCATRFLSLSRSYDRLSMRRFSMPISDSKSHSCVFCWSILSRMPSTAFVVSSSLYHRAHIHHTAPVTATATHTSVGTGSSGVTGQRFWPGRVGSRVSVTDPVSDPVVIVFARALLLLFGTEYATVESARLQ